MINLRVQVNSYGTHMWTKRVLEQNEQPIKESNATLINYIIFTLIYLHITHKYLRDLLLSVDPTEIFTSVCEWGVRWV